MARSSKKKAAPAKKGGSRSPKKVVRKGLHAPDVQAGESTRTVQKTSRKALRAPDVQAGRPLRTPQRGSQKVKKSAKAPANKKVVKDSRGRVRDYAAEYQRRLQRGEMLQLATSEKPSKAISRGHPRRKKGEIGLSEIRQLRHAVHLPSVKDQLDMKVKRPVQHEERLAARVFITEIAGIPSAYVEPNKKSIEGEGVKRFAEFFVAMGLGSVSDAFHLYFSP